MKDFKPSLPLYNQKTIGSLQRKNESLGASNPWCITRLSGHKSWWACVCQYLWDVVWEEKVLKEDATQQPSTPHCHQATSSLSAIARFFTTKRVTARALIAPCSSKENGEARGQTGMMGLREEELLLLKHQSSQVAAIDLSSTQHLTALWLEEQLASRGDTLTVLWLKHVRSEPRL